MSDLAQLKIWDDPAIRDGLSWYLAVAENRRPAKFRIAATLPPSSIPHVQRGGALGRARPPDADISRKVAGDPGGRAIAGHADGPSLLELCRELAYRMLAHCNFCPWNCRVDRRRARSSAPANSPPLRGSARISITPAKSCFTAARKVRARSSSPPATCGVPSVRTATSAPTRTTARKQTRARWRRWRGRCAAKAATTSIGSAAR